MATISAQVKQLINDWCNQEPLIYDRKKRQKYVICILDTLHDFYEYPVKINNVNYTKPDIVLKWAEHYFYDSHNKCPLSPLTPPLPAGVPPNIVFANLQQLNYVCSHATTIGKELLFAWWDQTTPKAPIIRYCQTSFQGTGTNTNKGIFVSRRQKTSFFNLTTNTNTTPLFVFSDQGVPKNPFKLPSASYVNSIGVGGLYDKNLILSKTSDIFTNSGVPIILLKGEFEGVLGYDSITIPTTGVDFTLNYNGVTGTRNINDTNLKQAKTLFRQYAITPAAPNVNFFTVWLNDLSISGNIGNILKTAIQTGTIPTLVFEYLSLIFDLKRIGDWSQSYELRGIHINSIFNTVDGIAAGCAVYFQEIATLFWRKSPGRSQGFELYNYNNDINCTAAGVPPLIGDRIGSPPSYPAYSTVLHPDIDFADVNTLNDAFTNATNPVMGGANDDELLFTSCISELTNNTNYYVELIMCRGDLEGRDGSVNNNEINDYAKKIREYCDVDIKTWVQKTQDEMETYFKQYFMYLGLDETPENLKNFLKERFKRVNDDTPDNDEEFYRTCSFSLFKYEFDKLTSDKLPPDNSKQIIEDIYSSIKGSCSRSPDTFETLTLFAKFFSYQLLRDTIIDFLNPETVEYVGESKVIRKVIFSDDSLNSELTLQAKQILIENMIKYELYKKNNERFVDLYDYEIRKRGAYDSGTDDSGADDSGADDSGAYDSGADDSGADDSNGNKRRKTNDVKTSGGKNVQNLNVKNLDKLKKPIIKPKPQEKQPKDKLKKPIIKPKPQEKQPKDKLKKPIIKPKPQEKQPKDTLKKPIIKPKPQEKQPKDTLKKPIIKPKPQEKQPKDTLKKPIIKPKIVTNIDNQNISKYKFRVEQFKNKRFSAYFENKIKKHLNDKNINIYKIGIMKMRGILKDIYKIN
jgi:hypothetical protein